MAIEHHEQYLEVRDRRGKLSRYLLEKGPVIIGRGTDAQVQLTSDSVSRHHAEMEVDDLRRWSVRDLNSRNGTYVNRKRLPVDEVEKHWQLIEPGDEVRCGSFRLVLMTSTPAIEGAMGQELSYFNVRVDERADAPVSTLEGAATARIDPALLTDIGALGMRMVHTRNAIKRLNALFEFVLSEEVHGQAVMALRLNKLRPAEAPRILVEPMFADDWPKDQQPHISRSALRAVLGRGQAVLAGGAPGGGGIEMSVTPDVPSAVMVCPLRSDEDSLDVVYVVVPPEFGNTDWLSIVALAARQYEIAETARHLRS